MLKHFIVSLCIYCIDQEAAINYWKEKRASAPLHGQSSKLLGFVPEIRQRARIGSPVIKVLDRGWFVMSSSPVPIKTRRVEQRCTLNLSRSQTSSRWCGVVVRIGEYRIRCRPRHLTMVQNYEVRRQKPSCS
ncbi:uncharacterized protein TNCV_718341 [Trichonephila clavipes]|nr:uncharacterized protein TNCV_718341 [Trichonephila clavipes]